MCGMFATVTVDSSIELPHFPEEIERENAGWQSKQGLDVYSGPYRVTSDGRLEKKRESYRDKTVEEKQAEAEKWGCDSWKEYVQLYEEKDGPLCPDELDWDKEEDGYEDSPPSIGPSEQVIDEVWWGDQSFHGTFEIHEILKRDPTSVEELAAPDGGTIERPSEYALDVFLEYELYFTEGDLTDVVFMGERYCSDEPVESALEKIEEWREWKEGE